MMNFDLLGCEAAFDQRSALVDSAGSGRYHCPSDMLTNGGHTGDSDRTHRGAPPVCRRGLRALTVFAGAG